MKFPLAAALLCLSLFALLPISASADDTVRISEPWARATIIASRPAAAYMTLESAQDDRLLEMKSPVADRVMIHATKNADGVARMVHLDVLELPAGEAVVLAPGHMHMMLVGLNERLPEGAEIPISLRFEHAGDVTVMVPVFGPGANGPAAGAQ